MLKFNLNQNKSSDAKTHYQSIDQWYQSLAGQRLLKDIVEASKDSLTQCFGYYAIQLGCPSLEKDLINKSRVRHQFVLDSQSTPSVLANQEQLPIANDSVDLVIAAHSLSYSKHPHALLREIDRILVPEGKLLIIEFNPFSLWGLRHKIQAWLEKMPWTGRLFSHHRLRDWLALLGFKETQIMPVHYDMPMSLDSFYTATHWIPKAFKRWLPFAAAVNVMLFEKAITPITPVKSLWKQQILKGSRVSSPYAGRQSKQ